MSWASYWAIQLRAWHDSYSISSWATFFPAKTLKFPSSLFAAMADVKNDEQDCALPPSKRKPDSCLEDADDQSKKPKTEIQMPLTGGEQLASEAHDDDDFEDQEDHSNGEVEVDRKGKVIMNRDDKGKGKMVEEDDESDDEHDSDGDSSSDDDSSSGDDDSDLSDDPLAEVDLDNILPSRTRRRAVTSFGISLGKTEEASHNAEAGKNSRGD